MCGAYSQGVPVQRPLARQPVLLSRRVIAYYGLICASRSLPPLYGLCNAPRYSTCQCQIILRLVSRFALCLSLIPNPLRTVLAVKGSLRRAKYRRALDGSGPFWSASLDERKVESGIACGLNVRKSPENIAEDYKIYGHVAPIPSLLQIPPWPHHNSP